MRHEESRPAALATIKAAAVLFLWHHTMPVPQVSTAATQHVSLHRCATTRNMCDGQQIESKTLPLGGSTPQ